MKRGIVRIVLGLILITLQIMSVIGNHMSGAIAFSPPVSSAQLLYDLIFYSSYYSIGIIGLILLISGLFAYIRSSRLSNITSDSESSKNVPELAIAADAVPKQVEESAHVPAPTPAPVKQKKQRAIFCKYCGQLIDQDTKKCTGCGKQYFRLPKAKKSAVVLWVVILLSVAAIGLCMRQRSQYQQQIESLNTQIAQLNTDLETANQSAENWKSRFDQEQSEKYKLQYERIALRQDLDFFNRHVVFVLDDGSREYHKYDCLLFKYRGNAKFWAYNTEAAKSKGYKTCSLCNK